MIKIVLSLLLITSHVLAKDEKNYQLIGESLLEVTIFKLDVYKISFYKAELAEKIKLKYLRDVEKKYSIMGWEQGLEKYDSDKDKKAKSWLISTTADIKENDVIEIEKYKDKVIIKKNGDKTHESSDKNVRRLVFEPWIGKYPVSKEMKKDLLGKK